MKIVDVFMAEWQRDYVPVPWTTWEAHDGCSGASTPRIGCPWDSGSCP